MLELEFIDLLIQVKVFQPSFAQFDAGSVFNLF